MGKVVRQPKPHYYQSILHQQRFLASSSFQHNPTFLLSPLHITIHPLSFIYPLPIRYLSFCDAILYLSFLGFQLWYYNRVLYPGQR